MPATDHPDGRLPAHWRAAVWLGAFAGLTVIASRPDGWLAEVDQDIIGLVERCRTRSAIRVAHAVSAMAEPMTAAVPLAAASAIAARREGWGVALRPGLTVLAGMAVRRMLSRRIARPRPPAAIWLIEPEGFSLPSRHTSLAALTAGAFATALGADPRVCDVAVVSAAAGVGASRVCLGVHWLTDVLAGWLFAAGWLELVRVVAARMGRKMP